jgi:hypothetical protein
MDGSRQVLEIQGGSLKKPVKRKVARLDPDVQKFNSLSVGDLVYFLFPFAPEDREFTGVILRRDKIRIRVRWRCGSEASFKMGCTGGWNLITKKEGAGK